MEGIFQSAVFLLCLFAPLALIAILGFSWLLGTGAISIPGVGRGAETSTPGETSVPAVTGGLMRFLAIVSGGAGSVIGFLGFLLPWFQLVIGGALDVLGQSLGASIGGQMSGISIAFYSLVGGIKLVGSKNPDAGTVFLGLFLILFSFMVFLIPVLLGVLAALGIGMIAVPLKLVNAKINSLARMMLILSLIGACQICLVFSILQATIGGIGISGSAGNAGTLMAGVQPAGGFMLTICGLLLTIFSAVTMISIAPAVEEWSGKLS
jgi:hypothetical protein